MKKNTFKFFNILILSFLITACSNQNPRVFKEPIYKSPEGEYEGFLTGYLADFIIEQYYTLDNNSSFLHASAVFSALNDSRHGQIFYWENNNFFGKVKIVLTYFPNKNVVCRHWIEQVAKVKKRNFNGSISYKDKNKTNKACYDFTTKNWKFTNYNI